MRLGFLPFVTWEGLQRTAAQWLRLWTWLEIGLMLEKLHCNELLFKILGRLFPRRAQTVASGLIALEYFPAVLSFVQSSAVRGIRRHGSPAAAPVHFIEKIRKFIVELMEEGAAVREESGTAGGREGVSSLR